MERIEKQPALLKRFEQLLSIVENSTGDIQKANEAEMRVIKELREMGNEALTAWGEQQVSTLTENYKKKEGCYQAGKKTLLAYDLWGNHCKRSAVSGVESNITPFL